MAASWSWGSSLLVGVSILQSMGFGPFAIWAVFNTVTIPLFLVLARRSTIPERIRTLRPVYYVMILLQVFIVFVNLQSLSESLGGGITFSSHAFTSPVIATALALAIGLVIVAAIHRYGFVGSYNSDQPQFALQALACLVIVLLAVWSGVPFSQAGHANPGDYLWAIWTGLGLLAAPYLDAQQQQRAEYISSDRAALIVGVAFGGYLVLVALVGSVLVSTAPLLSIPLAIAVLAVTTSTLDSAVAALQYLLSPRAALVVAVFAVVSWPLMRSLGVVGLFTLYSTGRLVAVAAALCYLQIHSRTGTGAPPPV